MKSRSNNIDEEIKCIRFQLNLTECLREESDLQHQKELSELRLKYERVNRKVNSLLETKNLKKSIKQVKEEIIALSENRVPSNESLLQAMVQQALHLLSAVNYQKSLSKAQRKIQFDHLEKILSEEIEKSSRIDIQLMNEVDHVEREMKKIKERYARLEWKGLVVASSESSLGEWDALEEEDSNDISHRNSIIAILEMAAMSGQLIQEDCIVDKKYEGSISQFYQLIKPEPQIRKSESARAC